MMGFGLLVMLLVVLLPILLVVALVSGIFGLWGRQSGPVRTMQHLSQEQNAAPILPRRPPAGIQTAAGACAHCGSGLQADWSHCPHCGAPLNA